MPVTGNFKVFVLAPQKSLKPGRRKRLLSGFFPRGKAEPTSHEQLCPLVQDSNSETTTGTEPKWVSLEGEIQTNLQSFNFGLTWFLSTQRSVCCCFPIFRQQWSSQHMLWTGKQVARQNDANGGALETSKTNEWWLWGRSWDDFVEWDPAPTGMLRPPGFSPVITDGESAMGCAGHIVFASVLKEKTRTTLQAVWNTENRKQHRQTQWTLQTRKSATFLSWLVQMIKWIYFRTFDKMAAAGHSILGSAHAMFVPQKMFCKFRALEMWSLLNETSSFS